MPRNSVTTWADGFGRWYAKVSIGYPAQSDRVDSARLRAAARRAIRRQLAARDAMGAGWRLSVEVVANHVGADNRLYSITYAEKETRSG